MAVDLPTLSGDRVILRRPRAGDAEERFKLGSHKEIVECYGGTFDPTAIYTRSHAASEIDFIEKHEFAWVIDADGFIGHVRFFALNWQDKRAAVAIGIEDPAHLGRGYGSEALRLSLGYILAKGLHRISLRVLASNSRAIACYRKCGFVIEGQEREAALINGSWQDDLVMGLLDREFACFPNGRST